MIGKSNIHFPEVSLRHGISNRFLCKISQEIEVVTAGERNGDTVLLAQGPVSVYLPESTVNKQLLTIPCYIDTG